MSVFNQIVSIANEERTRRPTLLILESSVAQEMMSQQGNMRITRAYFQEKKFQNRLANKEAKRKEKQNSCSEQVVL